MEKDYVVLLHGIARTAKSMRKIERALQVAGYETINIDYPSRKYSIEHLTDHYITKEIDKHYIDHARPIHFVTHSMGSLILRRYLESHKLEKLGRVVMLAPPNKGSEVVDYLKNNPLYKFVYGPAGQQLGTDAKSFARQMSHTDKKQPICEVGIIAGGFSINPLTSKFMLKGKDDGTVSVESTKLDTMCDHIIVKTTHLMIVKNRKVILQILSFLKEGHFAH